MKSPKARIRNAVSSSFINRASREEEVSSSENHNNIPRYAPFDDPEKVSKASNPIKKNNFDISYLSKTEIKVLNKINSMINAPNNLTSPVFLEELVSTLEHPITTLKKTIQKLEQKGFLKREFFKSGRGGWTVYSVDAETRAKLEPN